MGSGNRPDKTNPNTQTPRAEELSDSQSGLLMTDELTSWELAYGPEASIEELEEWARPRYSSGEPNLKYENAVKILEDPEYQPGIYSAFAPRRALESALAAWGGQELSEYKLENKHRSWAELNAEAESIEQNTVGGLSSLAALWERWHRGDKLVFKHVGVKLDEFVQGLIEKAGPGAQTGKLEDYSRAELRKLLGYLEREAKDFNDEDLRAMALEAGLVPRWKNSPAHAQLAAQAATQYSNEGWQKKIFQKQMRRPYHQLAKTLDEGHRELAEINQELKELNPFAGLVFEAELKTGKREHYNARLLEKMATAAQIEIRKPEEERYLASSKQTFMTPLEAQYKEAFMVFCEYFGGAKKLNHVHKGTKAKGVYGLYTEATGDIGINVALCKLIDRAKLGKATPHEIEKAIGTVAHELLHAVEERDEGNKKSNIKLDHTPEHTVVEGRVEALARLNVEFLASVMGVWDTKKQGQLREQSSSNRNSYAKEVETMIALAAACTGEFDKEKAQAGAYQEPEALGAAGRKFLEHCTTKMGADAHIKTMVEQLATSEDQHEQLHAELVGLLRECKSTRYQWRAQRVREEDPATGIVQYFTKAIEGEKLGDILAEKIGAWLENKKLAGRTNT
jgi:hypothetical protein